MLPVEQVIGEGGLSACADGARLAVRLPWYRSLPLSTIEVAGLAIDGAAVAPDAIRFEYAGASWDLDSLGEAVDVFWYVLDEARLFVPGLTLDPAGEHAVDVTIALHPPYIPGMRRANGQTAMLPAQEEARQ